MNWYTSSQANRKNKKITEKAWNCGSPVKKVSRLLLCFVFFSVSFFATQNSYATSSTSYGPGRTRTCDSSSGDVEGLSWAVDGLPGKSKDILFVLSNPVCTAVIASSYASVKVAIAAMNGKCGSGSSVPRVTPSPLLDMVDIAKATIKCATSQNYSCCGAVFAAGAAVSVAFGELALIYNISKNVYSGTKVCGSNWTKPDPTSYNISAANYKQSVQLKIEGYISDTTNDDSVDMSLSNKTYREWYYDGVEVEDRPYQESVEFEFNTEFGDYTYSDMLAGSQACLDPTESTSSPYPRQKYYLRGLQQGNYNCEKYHILDGEDDPATGEGITSERLATFDTAYKCCKNRSQNYICLDADYYSTNKNVFCKGGSRCTIGDITFSTKYLDDQRIICAETYSLCPYNFTISGGSEYCDYYEDGVWNSSSESWDLISQDTIDSGNCSGASAIRNSDCTYNDKANKCKNYCQYLTHCTVVSSATYEYQSELSSPYFSDACINFVGDSLNRTAYGTGFILGSQRHFSAPIAQCVKETLENLFYNVAGHSECLNVNESPASDGTCPSGTYIQDGNFTYMKGNTVKTQSFFSSIQSLMENIVKLILTLAVMFYGMNLLILKNDVRNKKDILMFILKIGLVLYFATGDAWQSMFFKGIYGASSEFSRMIFKIQVNDDEEKRDGCQFGTISLSDGSESTVSTYPSGKEYLAIWDTLDCKIARYLGFGPQVSTANIASLVFAGFLTGSIGIYFSLSIMFFGLMLVAATFRALHIFLSSWLSIIIFVFVSPLIITAAMFQKTKSIFDNWLKNLISFCFQPIILVAYISILVIVLDKTLIGSATFHGTAPSKTVSCSSYCEDANGNYVGNSDYDCGGTDETETSVDPMNDSIACMIGINSFSSAPGLQLIGITIPILKNVFSSNVKQKIITLLRGALVMYLLFKFMDEIPGIASRLIGGEALPGASGTMTDPMAMLKGATGFLKEFQKRAARGLRKGGKKAGEAARDRIKEMGSKGKQVSEATKEGGADVTDSSIGGSTNTAKTGGGSDSPPSS